MNVIVRPQQTISDFLDWERQQELAHEFDGHRVLPMNGGTVAHYLIATNLFQLVRSTLDSTLFRLVPSGVKVIVDGHVRYPDLIVASYFEDTTVEVVPEPVVVVEVTSPSSVTIDAVVKNLEYRATPSIQHYVILEQDAVAATVWSRDGDEWRGNLMTGDTQLHLPALKITVSLKAVYDGVTMPGAAK